MAQENQSNNMGWNFDNSYKNLPRSFYSEIDLNPVRKSELVVLNKPLAEELKLNTESLKSEEGLQVLAGNKKVEGGAYIAQAYSGHQFGNFTMLGDGRAVLIGEQKLDNKTSVTGFDTNRYDIQLKGSGKTPYSRGGDGRAVLGPMLREYIISEAMYNLGIPTTRSLAVVKTGENIYREYVKEGAILTRVATSHLRFGTFEYASNYLGKEEVKKLADYAIERHYPYVRSNENKYLSFLKEVTKAHAELTAKWLCVGFIHGVMNTDNMTISGETIDYGPCAFMDIYNPDTVFSSIDYHGRYAYKNQPKMASWNICRFAETLLPLISEDGDTAIDLAQKAIFEFSDLHFKYWFSKMRSKLGLFNEEAMDKAIIEDLLTMMEKYKEDYTNTFLSLTYRKNMNRGMFLTAEFTNWYKNWQERLERQEESIEEAYELMKTSNPVVIPRNHRVEEALDAADNGDFTVMENLLSVISNPYEYKVECEKYFDLPQPSDLPYRTYCGT
ncbi:protein adenylyltransferase SelO [Terrisporobacter glycolicus]|uniref:Protein nucleotidyltransferase YdiU n=1 Tax=Terrisporobacter glycolicus ATCC 14880 = DSM 1288 TaxID=1121315 RepID=A0ABZ2ER39_9FIRM|nr:YdiU family protein [Terrisporobacter glycolicus]